MVLDGNNMEFLSNELLGGVRISFVFYEFYLNGIKVVDFFDYVKDVDICIIFYNLFGFFLVFFVGIIVFEFIVK